MSIQYGNQYVDEKYVASIEPNLYTDTVLIPGVTYTDKYEVGPAGAIYVHKLSSGNAIVPGTPGRDFSDEGASDDLIPIVFNNNYQKSRKIYGVQASAVAFNIGEEYLADSLNVTKQGRQYSALACLAKEGTADTDTVAVSSSTAVAKLIALRKKIKDAHGQANYALVNTEIYGWLLGALGLQQSHDPAIVSGELLKRFGLNIIECNSFDLATAKYYDSTSTLQTVDLTDVEIIVGYSEAFSVLDNFETYRIVDSENFSGSKAQVEFNTALKVNSPAQVLVKKHA